MNLSEAYYILEIQPPVTFDVIKKAYRKKANETHPDKGGNAKDFIKVQAAYEILCDYHKNPIEQEIPIPDELKEIIIEIVEEFRKYYFSIEEICNQELDTLQLELITYINKSPRRKLREFNVYFLERWEPTLRKLFKGFNQQCNLLIAKYENWFRGPMEEIISILDEKYKTLLKSYYRNPRFYVIASILFASITVITYLITKSVESTNLMVNGSIYIGTHLLFIPIAWWLYCQTKREEPETVKQIKVLDVVPFRINSETDFVGSHELKKGAMNTINAGFLGAGIGSIFAEAGIEGAIIGVVIGEIANRVMNPTEKIRRMLLEEVQQFISAAKIEIIQYSMETQKKLLDEITEKIINNYESRIKKAVKLLNN
ncbi:MAG TPA: J domain-containing protein [Ignavibacteriaceae bacterium]|nr:J domain-containing protein [Ignavibacteriaceae bacterium]